MYLMNELNIIHELREPEKTHRAEVGGRVPALKADLLPPTRKTFW